MKQYSEACRRNEQPIAALLDEVLPDQSLILEIGSGTGQHGVAFSQRFPNFTWQPTDQPGHLKSIEAWRAEADLPNLNKALAFDLFEPDPPISRADAVVAINVIHIAPATATELLFSHAAALLDSGSPVILYGPYRYENRLLEESNKSFDSFLRRRDPESGLRVFEDVDEIARQFDFEHCGTRRLPANNDAHWWRKND